MGTRGLLMNKVSIQARVWYPRGTGNGTSQNPVIVLCVCALLVKRDYSFCSPLQIRDGRLPNLLREPEPSLFPLVWKRVVTVSPPPKLSCCWSMGTQTGERRWGPSLPSPWAWQDICASCVSPACPRRGGWLPYRSLHKRVAYWDRGPFSLLWGAEGGR